MTGHRFDSTILRKYDIRGIVGETLSAADAEAIGRTFASIVAERGGRFICLGRDGRLSSPELGDALCAGAKAAGVAVVDIGLAATPMLYYASKVLNADGAVMVTGSHNPPDYNGFKMVLENGPFWGEMIQAFGARAAAGEWRDGVGQSMTLDVLDAYVGRLRQDYGTERALKVAWDVGNASVGPAVCRLAASLPGEQVVLNEDVDGTFPAHHPDPTVPENLLQLQDAVRGMHCDLGVAFDGDGDRIGVVDGEGRVLWGDQILALYAAELLSRRPGEKIIADVKASQMLFDEVTRLGGEPIMAAPGHSIIKSLMVESGAPLAGEMSGHVFFADGYYGYDDALYAAVRLLDIVAKSDRSLAQMIDALPHMVNTPELRFDVTEARKFEIVDEVKARLAADGADVNDVDGVRVNGPDGWWLLRASNTQNALVGRCESSNEEGLARLKTALGEQLRASGVDAPAF